MIRIVSGNEMSRKSEESKTSSARKAASRRRVGLASVSSDNRRMNEESLCRGVVTTRLIVEPRSYGLQRLQAVLHNERSELCT